MDYKQKKYYDRKTLLSKINRNLKLHPEFPGLCGAVSDRSENRFPVFLNLEN